jgi:predicted phage terminase large subunit-like protein
MTELVKRRDCRTGGALLEASAMRKRTVRGQLHSIARSPLDPVLPEAPLTLPPRRYCLHVPTPKQLAFLLCPRKEAFFGGAAGPGKTDGLLSGALQLVEHPGYHALLLRRTFRQLNQTNSIMNRARQWLAGTDAVWKESDKRFTFPSAATITFGYLDSEDDVYQYDSSEFQYIGFDELTSFTERQYTYLFSRLRTTRDNLLPLRMRAASNPGNRGHDWVKARFMIGQPPETLQGEFPDRFFLPARIADNPHIRSDEYLASLANLDGARRRQLLDGDWEVMPSGNLFRRHWFSIVDDWPREVFGVVRAWDDAASRDSGDWSVGVLMALARTGVFYVIDVVRIQGSPLEVERLKALTAHTDAQLTNRRAVVLLQQEPGAAGKSYVDAQMRGPLLGFTAEVEHPTGDKYTRALPMSSAAQAGNLKLLRGKWNKDFLDELEQAGPDEKLYDHDDQWDAASSGFNWLAQNQREYAYTPAPRNAPSQFESLFGRPRHPVFDEDLPDLRGRSRRFGPGAW